MTDNEAMVWAQVYAAAIAADQAGTATERADLAVAKFRARTVPAPPGNVRLKESANCHRCGLPNAGRFHDPISGACVKSA